MTINKTSDFKLLVCTAAFLMLSMSFNTHMSSFSIPKPSHQHMMVSPVDAATFSAGYSNMLAVISWVRLIDYYGGTSPDARNYAYIGNILKTIINMNPRAEHAYYMSGAAIPWATHSTELSRPLLIRAMHEFPKAWRWPFYLGFNAYWFDHDQRLAASYLAIAARKKNAPPIVTALAIRMKSQAGSLDAALAFLETLMQQKQDASMLKTLLEQKKALLTEKVLQHLDAVLARATVSQKITAPLSYLKRVGALPVTLPDGGRVIMYKGRLVSSKHKKRYKVYAPARRTATGNRSTHH